MEYSYRIKANVGVDQVLNVNLKGSFFCAQQAALIMKEQNYNIDDLIM